MKILTMMSIAFVLFLTGCASDSVRIQAMGANIELAKQHAERAAKPILDARIPTPSGEMRIIVNAPQTGNQPVITMPEDPAWRVAERLVGVIGTAASIYVGGEAAVGLVRATGSGIVGALKSQPAPTVVMPPSPVIVQPAEPIIVTQPAPIVVPQPAPIIVTQPAPIIVNPVIVPAP